MSNTCVICGCDIPEGTHVCPSCLKIVVNSDGPKGHWYINPDGWYPQCSNCWCEPDSGNLEPVCPNCGAIMEGTS